MVQEYLNLEEAARELGITKEDLSKKAQRREIRAFADRGSWKFRKQDIQEHARQVGIGSGAEIVFGDLDAVLPTLDEEGSSDQILLSEQSMGDAGDSSSGARVIGMDEHGRTPSDSDVRLVAETLGQKKSDSDVKLVGGTKPPSDSDVKVVPAPTPTVSDSDVKIKGPVPGDSDVRLDRAKAPTDSGVRISPDTLGASGPTDLFSDSGSGGSSSGSGGSSSSGDKLLETEPDSDFELGGELDKQAQAGPGAGKRAASGDSDITLALDDNTGLVPDEIKLGVAGPSDSDVTGHPPSKSGINLDSPADSGIALDEAPPAAGRSGRGLGATEGPAKSGSDIFETDFEVPSLSSGDNLASSSESDTAQIAPDSDFELTGSDIAAANTDSSGQVLALEGEEVVDESASTSLAAAAPEEQWEEEIDSSADSSVEFVSQSGSVSGVSPRAALPSEDSGAAPALVPIGAADTEWSGVWVGLLCFSTVLMVVLGILMVDLVRTMWGWQEGFVPFYKSPILNWLSSLLPK